MNKVGKKDIFDNLNMDIDFTLDDIFEHFGIDALQFRNGGFLDVDNNTINIKLVETYIKPYIDAKVKEEFGDDYEIFSYYDNLKLSWNVEIEAISKITDYRKSKTKELKLPKLKKVSPFVKKV